LTRDFPFDVISAEEYDRLRDMHEPLTQSLRRLIEAGIAWARDLGGPERCDTGVCTG
jgi:hypothetical protein